MDFLTSVKLAIYRHFTKYDARLEPSARRPGPAEMREIFAGLGLTGAFWDLEADNF